MRVAIVSPVFGETGGPELGTIQLADALADAAGTELAALAAETGCRVTGDAAGPAPGASNMPSEPGCAPAGRP